MEKGSFVKVKILILSLCFIGVSVGSMAERYTIVFLNTPSVKIGGNLLKLGDSFDDQEIISWTDNDKQMMKVKDGKGRVYKITRRGFKKYEKGNASIKSLAEFLIHEQYLGTRDKDSRKHYTEQEFYLTDTLHFQTFSEKINCMGTEAVWYKDGKEITTPITRTVDGLFYVVSLSIYKDEVPCDIKLGIREYNDALNWVNNIYQDIPIIYIPKSIEDY